MQLVAMGSFQELCRIVFDPFKEEKKEEWGFDKNSWCRTIVQLNL
jgi:hypothetical protein